MKTSSPVCGFRGAAVLCLLLLLLSGCGVGSRTDLRDRTLFQYAGAIRWGHIDDAWTLVDPEYARKHPLTALERERFAQVQVSGYRVRGVEALSETEFMQWVEIDLINRHTLVHRTIQEREHWRWDAQNKRWWLTSGLPRLTP